MNKKNKIIIIDWVDSCSYNGWRSDDDMGCKAGTLPCQTVGYLVNKSKTAIAIAQNRTLAEGYKPYGDIIHIPKSAIKGKRFLEDNKKRR